MDMSSEIHVSATASARPIAISPKGPGDEGDDVPTDALAAKVEDILRRREKIEGQFLQCTEGLSQLARDIVALAPILAQAYGSSLGPLGAVIGEHLSPAPLPPASAIVVGVVNLADESGAPLVNREVLVSGNMLGQSPDGKVLYVPGQRKLPTDKNGHAEFQLVRGLEVIVAVAGTEIRRNVVVPTNPEITEFNLLDPFLGNDMFGVQHPTIDYAVRRSL
ncbi:hypothetical protein LVJ94_35415 [Pendulispora rubella]|uniref:Carboxypeptidase regulatory-like domain-containing protein n=1 Tax=Pendulispora rubella TaxID=2741070 RepID=A0ABZ2KU89_9BACT